MAKKRILELRKLKSKNGTPVLPPVSKFDDPTKQAPNRVRAFKKIDRKVARITSAMNVIIRELPKRRVSNQRIYEFLVDQSQIALINQQIITLLNNEYLSNPNGDFTDDFWLNTHITAAYDAGADDTIQSAKNLVPASTVGAELSATVRAISPEIAKFDLGRIRRASIVRARVFEEMKGMTASVAADLSRTLDDGIQRGLGVQEISKNIAKRVGVSGSRATKIARTEINNTYRLATWGETDALNEEVFGDSDFEMRSLWFSALASTTRKTHARRHGRTYTTDEVRDFYSRDANAINCYCSQSSALVNKKTGEIMQKDLQGAMTKQRESFEQEDPADLDLPAGSGRKTDPDFEE